MAKRRAVLSEVDVEGDGCAAYVTDGYCSLANSGETGWGWQSARWGGTVGSGLSSLHCAGGVRNVFSGIPQAFRLSEANVHARIEAVHFITR